MGLIHSRASKKRDKQQAKLLKAQRKEVKAGTKADQAGTAKKGPDSDKPIMLQPTIGAAVSEWRRRRNGTEIHR